MESEVAANTKRIFLALPASDPLESSFLPFLKKLRITGDKEEIDVKWSPPKNYHLTILFLGEKTPDEIEKLHAPITAFAKTLAPFDLRVSGMGAFPDEHHARVLWLGVQNKKNLPEMENTLRGLLGLGEATETYVPHITIARIRKTRSCKNLLSPFVRKDFGKIHVDKFVLFESIQQNFTSVYLPLAEYPFEGAAD